MSEQLANPFSTSRQLQHRTTTTEFAAAAIFAILVIAQLTLVAQARDTLDAAAQLAPFGIFAPLRTSHDSMQTGA